MTPPLTAADVKAALRRRHPAYDPRLSGVGRWTTICEWQNIDLLALDAWRPGEVIGYEVKVSRSDYRSELLDPTKRQAAVAMCTRFYFAVPAGLLTPEERAWEEPKWSPEDFVRQRCTNPKCWMRREARGYMRNMPKPRGPILRGTEREGVSVDLGSIVDRGVHPHGGTYTHHLQLRGCCVVCKGRGTTERCRAEEISPMLWVPKDVGLISVGPRGCAVLREAPKRTVTEPIIPWPYLGYRREDGPPTRSRMKPEDISRLERQAINSFARWVSARPDPRHLGRRNTDISDGAVEARLLDEAPAPEPETELDVDVEEPPPEPRAWIG